MNFVSILISIILGSLSGWIAGKLMKNEGTLVRDIVLGIIGGFIGSALFGLIGVSFAGYFGTILESVVGACLLIFIVNKLF